MESALNGLSFAVLLTSLYILRFRGWRTPWVVVFYLTFFASLEVITSYYFLPPGAFGPWLAIVCFGLTIPVSIAAFLVWRHERCHDEGGDEGVSRGIDSALN